MSNQRPRIVFDKNGVCVPCGYTDLKKKGIIDYDIRKNKNIFNKQSL